MNFIEVRLRGRKVISSLQASFSIQKPLNYACDVWYFSVFMSLYTVQSALNFPSGLYSVSPTTKSVIGNYVRIQTSFVQQ